MSERHPKVDKFAENLVRVLDAMRAQPRFSSRQTQADFLGVSRRALINFVDVEPGIDPNGSRLFSICEKLKVSIGDMTDTVIDAVEVAAKLEH